VVVLVDRFSFGTADETSRAELGAVQHALAEYGIEQYLLSNGDDVALALGSRERARAGVA